MFSNILGSSDSGDKLFEIWRPWIVEMFVGLTTHPDYRHFRKTYGLIDDYKDFPPGMLHIVGPPNVAFLESYSYNGILVNLGYKKNCFRVVGLYKGSSPGKMGYNEIESDPVDPRLNPGPAGDKNVQTLMRSEVGWVARFLLKNIKEVADEIRYG